MKKFVKTFTLAASLTGASSVFAYGGYDADKVDLYKKNSNARGEEIMEYVGSKPVPDTDGCMVEALRGSFVKAVCKFGGKVVAVIEKGKDGRMGIKFRVK